MIPLNRIVGMYAFLRIKTLKANSFSVDRLVGSNMRFNADSEILLCNMSVVLVNKCDGYGFSNIVCSRNMNSIEFFGKSSKNGFERSFESFDVLPEASFLKRPFKRSFELLAIKLLNTSVAFTHGLHGDDIIPKG